MKTDSAALGARCPICASEGKRRTAYRLSAFHVIQCSSCGALQRDPLPSAEEMQAYYRDPAYIDGGYFDDPSKAAAPGQVSGWTPAAGASPQESPEFEIFRETVVYLSQRRTQSGLSPIGRLLDVGAGAGTFLELARAYGWIAEGVELSPELAARAEERSGGRVQVGDFLSLSFEPASFDVVTLWDVLEHTADPGAFLDRAKSLLAPGGVLLVFTIDAASLFNSVAHLLWRLSFHQFVRPLELLYDKRHNHYFTADTLQALLLEHGLRVEHMETHRAHLGRWLSEPASPLVLAGAEIIDALSVPLGRPYRQLLYTVAA